jgi:glucose-1-phosphate thymidylyltransferase
MAGKPVSQRCLEDMRGAGVRDVCIILGGVNPARVREFYGSGSRLGMHLTYLEQGPPLGVAHALSLSEQFVGEDRFILYLGDTVFGEPVKEHAGAFASASLDAMLLLARSRQHAVSAIMDKGRVVDLAQNSDPRRPESTYAVTGVYFFTPKIFRHIGKRSHGTRSELTLVPAIRSMLRVGAVGHRLLQTWWCDTGILPLLLKANRLQLAGGTYTGPGTTIDKASLLSSVSVGSKCALSGCRVSNSIIMDECTVSGNVELSSSLLGSGTQVTCTRQRHVMLRNLITGERSRISF